jgi:hypothetical protein
VRGTSRRAESLPLIEAAGAEGVVADPDRLATLMPRLDGVSVLCWLMGGVALEALHGPRLESLLEKLVDTHVRGVVYEARGELGERGTEIVRRVSGTYRMPAEVVDRDAERWVEAMSAAVARVLAA